MRPQAALAVVVACASAPLSLKQAQMLVLAAPNIRTSVSDLGARPFFEWVHREGAGWHFDVKARNACPSDNACSSLLGHYAVDRTTGEVEDLDANGGDGALVSSVEMKRLRTRFRTENCRQRRAR
jgi:hypothetical protein